MKRIGIDARLIGQTGVGRYVTNLLRYLPSLTDLTFYVYTLKNNVKNIPKNQSFLIRETNYKWHTLAEQTAFLKTINDDNLDFVHFTYFSYPLFYRKKFIITLHDMIPYFYKTGKATTGNKLIYEVKHFFYKKLIQNAIKQAVCIITPSSSVKSEIMGVFGDGPKNKIQVIYEGIADELIYAHENDKLQKEFADPFFIYVGNFYPHKNVDNLIRAFAQTSGNIKLILIGPSDFFSGRLFQLVNQLKQRERIVFFKNPTDGDLKFFYKHAQGLIHPSLSEGCGLPVLEAAYFRCPIIASNIGVFNEILSGAFIKFNPSDVQDIKEKIEEQISRPKSFDYQMILQRFSFKKMAEATFRIYKKVMTTDFKF